jgi:hypothetical protein
VGSDFVVVAAPALDEDERLLEGIEDLPGAKLVAQLPVEALAIAVFQGLPGSM